MSLPSGILNRPALVGAHPVVVGRVLSTAARVLILLTPLLIHVAVQVPGVKLRRRCAQIETQIGQESLQQQRLLAKREALLAPERLRQEAERLGLVAPPPQERPQQLGAAPPQSRGAR